IKTLHKALDAQRTRPHGLVLHSDQGSQFTSLNFILCCEEHGIQQSMSRAGCPYDNAPMERYYNSLKAELIDRFHFHTEEQLDYAVAEYAYLWYNQIRPHSYNNYLTPLEARNSLD
ncbi:MAG: integrase core domain-containing protein, partial [Bacteroidales bacterium]|nr:integrase core domain-containing protein [Bacteroidales bacterium]